MRFTGCQLTPSFNKLLCVFNFLSANVTSHFKFFWHNFCQSDFLHTHNSDELKFILQHVIQCKLENFLLNSLKILLFVFSRLNYVKLSNLTRSLLMNSFPSHCFWVRPWCITSAITLSRNRVRISVSSGLQLAGSRIRAVPGRSVRILGTTKIHTVASFCWPQGSFQNVTRYSDCNACCRCTAVVSHLAVSVVDRRKLRRCMRRQEQHLAAVLSQTRKPAAIQRDSAATFVDLQ